MANEQSPHAQQLIQSIQHEYGNAIAEVLRETSRHRLKGKGKVTVAAEAGRNSVRWTLAWMDGEINFDLNVVATIEDDGVRARIGRVWVQRHASTPLDFDGHTPTTRMRRLTSLSLAEIREAIEAEWG